MWQCDRSIHREAVKMELVVSLVVALVAVLASFGWWWNELRYVQPVKRRFDAQGTKLPLGSMGLPFLGELPTFLWYFKFLRRPDEYIDSKRRK